MTKIVIYFFIILFSLVSGCKNNVDENDTVLWNESSQRLVIVKTGGFAPVNEIYDYFRDTLPEKSLEILKQIEVDNADLGCANDGFQYEVAVTNSSCLAKYFYGNRQVCTEVEKATQTKNYVKIQFIEELISSLNEV